jgi:SAM-dependent methyltransferase
MRDLVAIRFHLDEPPIPAHPRVQYAHLDVTRVFRTEPLLDILAFVDACVTAGTPIELGVIDPDRGRGHYAGELVDGYIYRPWRVWLDLAERRGLRMLTPRAIEPGLVQLRFELLDRSRQPRGDHVERYGVGSTFARISKAEDPGFVIDLADALGRMALPAEPRVLSLGVNTGDELALLMALGLGAARFVGVDHSASALAVARSRFGDAVELVEADLGALPELGRFDLVVAIGVLQSASLDDRALVRRIVQDLLAPAGAVIFGMPNCRYVDGETEYGARMVNFRQPELGLLVKDVAFYRKYLQQHDRQVFVTGKHYVLITAVAAT